MGDTKRVWVALGSNLGDSNRILQQAWQELGEKDEIDLIRLSSPYVSEPMGMESENFFLNAVGIFETTLPPEPLLALLQQVERGFGREKKSDNGVYQDRLLDLDILYFDTCIVQTVTLIVPHPHMGKRLFVLAPLVEIDPSHCDPISMNSIDDMYRMLLQEIKSKSADFQEIERSSWI